MDRSTCCKSAFFFLLLLPALLIGPDAGAAAGKTRSYDSPEAAAADLAAAAKMNDVAALSAILGPAAKNILESGDPVADAADRATFAAAYAERHALSPANAQKDRYFLEIGRQSWPFPAPLTRDAKSGRWAFDGKEGVSALLARRIGHNELSAMQVCRAFADAQHEYWRMNPEMAPAPHYAARVGSTPGKRDGLYWKDGPESPLGLLVAAAAIDGYAPPDPGNARPYFGYRYRILTGQGKNAPGGALDYMENGNMRRGFALLAWPDRYGVSGVMTFMINQDGVVYEKNLGKKTAAAAQRITRFDPDKTWRRAEGQ